MAAGEAQGGGGGGGRGGGGGGGRNGGWGGRDALGDVMWGEGLGARDQLSGSPCEFWWRIGQKFE